MVRMNVKMGSSVVHTLMKLRSDENIDTRRFNHDESITIYP